MFLDSSVKTFYYMVNGYSVPKNRLDLSCRIATLYLTFVTATTFYGLVKDKSWSQS